MPHSWETDSDGSDEGPSPAQAHEWESANSDEACDSDSDLDGETPPQDELLAYLIDLLLTRTLNAKQFSVIMHWVGKSGVPGLAPYGLRPDAPSGHYQRHLNSVLGHLNDTTSLYSFDIPGYSPAALGRTTHKFHTRPPHEQLEKFVSSDLAVQT